MIFSGWSRLGCRRTGEEQREIVWESELSLPCMVPPCFVSVVLRLSLDKFICLCMNDNFKAALSKNWIAGAWYVGGELIFNLVAPNGAVVIASTLTSIKFMCNHKNNGEWWYNDKLTTTNEWNKMVTCEMWTLNTYPFDRTAFITSSNWQRHMHSAHANMPSECTKAYGK